MTRTLALCTGASSGIGLAYARAPASLTGLRLGETICVPGLEDQSVALVAAENTLLFGGNQSTLATRYRQSANS